MRSFPTALWEVENSVLSDRRLLPPCGGSARPAGAAGRFSTAGPDGGPRVLLARRFCEPLCEAPVRELQTGGTGSRPRAAASALKREAVNSRVPYLTILPEPDHSRCPHPHGGLSPEQPQPPKVSSPGFSRQAAPGVGSSVVQTPSLPGSHSPAHLAGPCGALPCGPWSQPGASAPPGTLPPVLTVFWRRPSRFPVSPSSVGHLPSRPVFCLPGEGVSPPMGERTIAGPCGVPAPRSAPDPEQVLSDDQMNVRNPASS